MTEVLPPSNGAMMQNDRASASLGMVVHASEPGRAVVSMLLRDDMMNGFDVTHGGIVFGLADSAHAFATNTDGEISVAIDCSIGYPAAVRTGDLLTATAEEQSTTNHLGFCEVTVKNQFGTLVGHFSGTVYRTHKPLPA